MYGCNFDHHWTLPSTGVMFNDAEQNDRLNTDLCVTFAIKVFIVFMVLIFIRIRIRNLYCPYFTGKHQGTRKYINKDIWVPTHYKQTKTLSEYKAMLQNHWIQYRTKMTMTWLAHIVAYTTGHSCNNPPEGHRTRRGRHCSETIKPALAMSWSATATAPPRIMCHPGRD